MERLFTKQAWQLGADGENQPFAAREETRQRCRGWMSSVSYHCISHQSELLTLLLVDTQALIFKITLCSKNLISLLRKARAWGLLQQHWQQRTRQRSETPMPVLRGCSSFGASPNGIVVRTKPCLTPDFKMTCGTSARS